MLAIAFFSVVALSVAVPVAAQPFIDEPNGPRDSSFATDVDGEVLSIGWSQFSSERDTIDFYGPPFLRSGRGLELINTVVKSFGIDSGAVKRSFPSDELEWEGEPPQVVIEPRKHLLNKDNNFRTDVDVDAIVSSAKGLGFSLVTLELCPAIKTDFAFASQAGDSSFECRSWDIPTSESRVAALTMTQRPSASNYWNVVTTTIVVVVLVSVFVGVGAWLLRRGLMRTLGVANLVLGVAGAVAAAVAVTVAAFVYGFFVDSIDDIVMVNEYNIPKHAVMVMIPSWLVGLPFVVAAIVFIWAEPKPFKAEPVRAKGGIPSWMTGGQAQTAPEPSSAAEEAKGTDEDGDSKSWNPPS